MITLEHNRLAFHFPGIDDAPPVGVSVSFQRTLRLPDDGRSYPLPAGLGTFPLRHTDDYAGRLPEAIARRGGVIMPMWQSEAMWISFSAGRTDEAALKVAAGKINAVTGGAWSEQLAADPQDYLALPGQPWLDGFAVGKGKVRQFVAAPLGHGITAEEQLTGAGEHGGLQLLMMPLRAELRERRRPEVDFAMARMSTDFLSAEAAAPSLSMGLAAGGSIRQVIEADRRGIAAWDAGSSRRLFVTILNAEAWQSVTGEPPPNRPIKPRDYEKAKIPWFEHYGAGVPLEGSAKLAALTTVKDAGAYGLDGPEWIEEPVVVTPPVRLGAGRRPVREAEI